MTILPLTKGTDKLLSRIFTISICAIFWSQTLPAPESAMWYRILTYLQLAKQTKSLHFLDLVITPQRTQWTRTKIINRKNILFGLSGIIIYILKFLFISAAHKRKHIKNPAVYLKQVYRIKPSLDVVQFNVTFIYTCLTFGTIIRCCTIRVWQMDAIRVKTSSLAESLQTIFSRVFVCCFVSSFFRHSSVIYWTDILPSPYKHKEKFALSF